MKKEQIVDVKMPVLKLPSDVVEMVLLPELTLLVLTVLHLSLINNVHPVNSDVVQMVKPFKKM